MLNRGWLAFQFLKLVSFVFEVWCVVHILRPHHNGEFLMSHRRLPLTVLLLTCVSVTTVARAQNADSWLDKQVMVTSREAELKAGEKTIGSVQLARVLTVNRVQGSWLWIKDVGGWINRNDVVLFDQAVDHFTQQLQRDRSSDAYHQRAVMWVAMNKIDQAVSDFDEAIERDQQNSGLYNARGNALRITGKLDRALADFNEIIRRKVQHPAVYTNRGLVWFDKGEYDQALADYSQALQLDSKFAPAWEGGGTARQAQGNFLKAVQNFSKAVEADPNFHLARNNLAWVLATCPDSSVRNGKQAIVHATKACELTGYQDAGYLDTLAAAYAEARQFEDASQRVQEAILLAGEKEKAAMNERLKLYESRKPFRDRKRNRVAPPSL
jgi:tetratricopeptide (TPR) repeat protein